MVLLEDRSRVATLARTGLFLAALLGLSNMLWRVRGDLEIVDFRLFWVAGRAWIAGMNPYHQAQYEAMGTALAGGWSPVMIWPYPPHALPLIVPFSLLSYEAGLIVWNAAGILLSIIGALLLGRLFGRSSREALALAAAVIAYLGLMSASGSTLQVGQTSFFILSGIILIAWGIGREAPLIGGIGMAIVMLKPHIGLVLCCTIPFFFHAGVRMTAWGVALTLLASIPGFAIGGVGPTIGGLMHNLVDYRAIAYNTPGHMTGVANLIRTATGHDMSALVMSLVGCAVSLAIMTTLRLRRGKAGRPEPSDAAAAYLLVSLATVAAFVVLHVYDLMILCPLVAILPRMGWTAAITWSAPLIILMRPENLGKLVGLEDAGAPVAAVGGVLLLALGIAIILRFGKGRGPMIAPVTAAH